MAFGGMSLGVSLLDARVTQRLSRVSEAMVSLQTADL